MPKSTNRKFLSVEEKRSLQRLRHNEVVVALLKELKGYPCMDCDREFPYYCMDFHHRDPDTKLGGVAQMGTPEAMRREAAKCDLLCACCHRIRTHNEGYRRPKKKEIQEVYSI